MVSFLAKENYRNETGRSKSMCKSLPPSPNFKNKDSILLGSYQWKGLFIPAVPPWVLKRNNDFWWAAQSIHLGASCLTASDHRNVSERNLCRSWNPTQRRKIASIRSGLTQMSIQVLKTSKNGDIISSLGDLFMFFSALPVLTSKFLNCTWCHYRILYHPPLPAKS